MKTYAYELSPEDQKRLFFRAWYRDPKLMYTRILAGPLCLVLAVLCFIFQVGWIYVAAGVGLVFTGLYYVAQPFLVFSKGRPSGLVAALTVASDEFRYEDAQTRTAVPRQLIQSLRVRGDYLFLGIKADKLTYVVFDLRRIADSDEFLDKFQRMTGIR
jgi:hypothetical protein